MSVGLGAKEPLLKGWRGEAYHTMEGEAMEPHREEKEAPPLYKKGAVDFLYDSQTTVADLQERVRQQFPSKLGYIEIGVVRRKGRVCWEKRSMTILPRDPKLKVKPFFDGAYYLRVFDEKEKT